ncbi:MAG TPA: hypothetical protein VJB16_05385, partial [archaeon]|nr:hypothetical protein [archaeon]
MDQIARGILIFPVLLCLGWSGRASADEPPAATGFELENREVPETLALELVSRLPYLLGPVGRARVSCHLVSLGENASRVCSAQALERHRAVAALGDGFEERLRGLTRTRVARAASVQAINPACVTRWRNWNSTGLEAMRAAIGGPGERSGGDILESLRTLSASTGPLGTGSGPLTMEKLRAYCSFWTHQDPDSVLEEALSFFLSSYGGKKMDPACTKLGTPGYDTVDALLARAADFIAAERGTGSDTAHG